MRSTGYKGVLTEVARVVAAAEPLQTNEPYGLMQRLRQSIWHKVKRAKTDAAERTATIMVGYLGGAGVPVELLLRARQAALGGGRRR